MEPPFLATELRKLLLWLTLECFRRNSFENRSIGLVELVVCLKKQSKVGVVLSEVGVASKNLRAHRAQRYIRTTLLEILDPPLHYNIIFRCPYLRNGKSYDHLSCIIW